MPQGGFKLAIPGRIHGGRRDPGRFRNLINTLPSQSSSANVQGKQIFEKCGEAGIRGGCGWAVPTQVQGKRAWEVVSSGSGELIQALATRVF